MLVALAPVLPLTADAEGNRTESYTGVQIGSGEENVRFRVRQDSKGVNLTARFEATDVSLVCKGDHFTFPEIDVPAIKLPFLSPTVFQGQRYKRRRNEDWSYYEVKGRLLGSRRAIGYLYYIEDPFDPPGTEDEAECSTGGQLYQRWKAKRAR